MVILLSFGLPVRLLHTNELTCVADMQVTAKLYHIVTPTMAGTYFNVRIQINQSEGHVGFYYNPSWGGQPDADSDIAFAGNAVWETGMLLRTVSCQQANCCSWHCSA